jgi:hypothetical protein
MTPSFIDLEVLAKSRLRLVEDTEPEQEVTLPAITA